MLKILHLDYFKIVTGTFNKLLSGCHALEELLLYNLMWDKSLEPGPCFVNVSIPTLKRLTFCRFEEFDEAEDFNKSVSLSIFENPNLVYIEYIDSIADRYQQQVSLDSLVEASLGLRLRSDLVYNQRYHETEYHMSFKEKSNVITLLTGICNVKILCLSDNTLEGMHHISSDRCEDEDGCLCRYPTGFGVDVVARTCLSSSPVKVLKKVFKKLEKLPRVASANCKIQLISDNLSLSSNASG
ncbi:unnamed protein product [Arabidopsis arenosa]|uniref:FBD domain-containing protein n=1 Tax=Arabidopsis arenosa TaxID=38785 RepID=A0A8S2AZM1_ARAAE|nr:unnamed protein product [Arabidopsis arenosa]